MFHKSELVFIFAFTSELRALIIPRFKKIRLKSCGNPRFNEKIVFLTRRIKSFFSDVNIALRVSSVEAGGIIRMKQLHPYEFVCSE